MARSTGHHQILTQHPARQPAVRLWVALLAIFVSSLVAACKVQRSVVFDADGSGTVVSEIIIDRMFTEMVVPEMRTQLEAQLKSHPGATPGKVREYINARGDTVFEITASFRNATEIGERGEQWHFQSESLGVSQSRFHLVVQFTGGNALRDPVEHEYRVKMPGTIERTNGTKVSDREVVWRRPTPFPQRTRLEAVAVGAPYLTTNIAISVAIIAFVAIAFLAWGIHQRQSSAAAGAAVVPRSVGVSALKACPQCGMANTTDAKFCGACGTLMVSDHPQAVPVSAVAICPRCRATVVAGDVFCDNCGLRMA